MGITLNQESGESTRTYDNVVMTTTEELTEGRRSLTNSWAIYDVEHPSRYPDEAPSHPVLQISTYHYKERKMLVTSITRITSNGRINRYVVEIGNGDTCPVSSYVGERIARYSEKALRARHAQMLEETKVYQDQLIQWAAAAKHD